MAIQGPVGKENLVCFVISRFVLVIIFNFVFSILHFDYKVSHSSLMGQTMLCLARNVALSLVPVAMGLFSLAHRIRN